MFTVQIGFTSLMLAAGVGRDSKVELLVDSEANLLAKDNVNITLVLI
jgi:hypothetical protein